LRAPTRCSFPSVVFDFIHRFVGSIRMKELIHERTPRFYVD
jgi:hypothetical protein